MESSNDDETNFLYAWQIASMVQVPMILKTAIELGILEMLGQHHHPLSPADIASRLPISVTNPDAAVFIDRILRVLATYNIVTCVLRDQLLPPGCGDECERRLYGPAPVGKFFTKNKVDGGSLASVCLTINDEVYMGSWLHLKEAIVEGKFPFNCVHGMTPFEYASRDVRFNKVFNQGVADKSTIIMTKILQTYTGFHGLNSLVDVGGGTGVAMRTILSKYPSIKGIVFDLPHVIAQAPPHPGVEHVGGDMLVSVPKGDAIFMKSIIHDWSDESCIIFLKNCYKSLPEEGGKVIVAEFIMPTLPDPDNVETKLVVLTDCLMMALTPGGKERTKAQFEWLAKASGFTGIQVACCAYGTYIIEFLKTPSLISFIGQA